MITSEETDARRGALNGVRVVDLTQVVAGPYCTKLLADLGADVVKVESPGGDISRHVGFRRSPGMSSNFMTLNTNKRSILLDLKQAEGKDVLDRLIASSTVFVSNYRPDALARLGLAYRDVADISPEIIYCGIVGFGEDHPYHGRPVIDDVIQAMTGFVTLQRELGDQPTYVGMPISDLLCGLFATVGILGALHRRTISGHGEEIEVPMYEATANFVLTTHLAGCTFEPPLGPPLYTRSASREKRPYPTSDGLIAIAPYMDKHWYGLLDVLGLTSLLDDPRFATTSARIENLDALYEAVGPRFGDRPTEEWLDLLNALDIPAGPVRSTSDLIGDRSLEASGMLYTQNHPSEGLVRALGAPVQLRESGADGPPKPAPTPGADTESVLADLGYSDAAIGELGARGVASNIHA